MKQVLAIEVHKKLTSMLDQQAAALPEGFEPVRFIQNAMSVLLDTKGVDDFNPVDIARCLLKGAFLGLDFMQKECYCIPYAGKAQFQTDWKGEAKLIRLYSVKPVADCYAKEIKEGDDFRFGVRDGKPFLEHSATIGDKPVIGVYAVVLYTDGTFNYDVMTSEEVNKTRDRYSRKDSKGNHSQLWVDSYTEAAKKTVFRRMRKMISLLFKRPEQDQALEDGQDSNINLSERSPLPQLTAGQEPKIPSKKQEEVSEPVKSKTSAGVQENTEAAK